MARIILVTGGCRSGKSEFAEKCILESGIQPRYYLATSPVLDPEMAERVTRHRLRREHDGWITIEEELDLCASLDRCSTGAVLIDCITLWINNLMFAAEKKQEDFTEDRMRSECKRLNETLQRFEGVVVLVLNEVGLGIVPENKLARRYRDCSGRCGQMIAAAADEVYLTVCGIPLKIKG